MKYSVTLLPNGVRFEADAQLPILLAAQQAGLRLPSSCRNGTCRTCLCRVVNGKVRYEIEWPGLSAEEKNQGFILPCVAYAMSDVVIDEPRVRQID